MSLKETLRTSPVTARQIHSWTSQEPVLTRVRIQVQHGWSVDKNTDLQPCEQKSAELSVLDVLWGDQVLIPKKGQD